jgi:predicted phage terminase large subunit-like protein
MKTARLDGKKVRIRIEQEPGASGKSLIDYYVRLLAPYECKGISSGTSKLARWSPLASQAEHGNIILCNGPWNHEWIEEICAVPDANHDDQADSAAGAFHALVAEPPPVFGVSSIGGRRGANA